MQERTLKKMAEGLTNPLDSLDQRFGMDFRQGTRCGTMALWEFTHNCQPLESLMYIVHCKRWMSIGIQVCFLSTLRLTWAQHFTLHHK